jgi:type IV fimbrial biogenesis protein FimT
MLLKRRTSCAGFSIIELAVALTIACVLLALGAPAVSGYLQNARLGALAQSIYGGLQTARTEAVKDNQCVEFVLTNSALDATTYATIVPAATGRNWWVRTLTLPACAVPASGVESKSTNVSDLGGVIVTASSPAFIFNGLGAASAAGSTGIALTNPALGACAPGGPVRCWNVVVAPGGQIRLCSPDTSLPAGDSRAC